jgi:hypothetical protein
MPIEEGRRAADFGAVLQQGQYLSLINLNLKDASDMIMTTDQRARWQSRKGKAMLEGSIDRFG